MYDHFQNTRQPTQGEGKIILSVDIRCPAARVIYSAAFVIEMYGERGPTHTERHPRRDIMHVCTFFELLGKAYCCDSMECFFP